MLNAMSNPSQVKLLLKILIGAAWLDGTIQPEERQYLQQVAEAQGMATDREIKALIQGLVVIKPDECDLWVKEYLGNSPTQDSYQELLTAVSGLIYSDGEVATNEAKLLMSLQPNDSLSEPKPIVNRLRQFYQQITRNL
jgi:uncharacterized tellurite resistance protein B-like protein